MPEHFCINHVDRPAAARCHRCHKPVCEECLLRREAGLFCSDTCHQQFVAFRAKPLPEIRGPSCAYRLVQLLILLALLFGIIYLLARWGGVGFLRDLLKRLGGGFS